MLIELPPFGIGRNTFWVLVLVYIYILKLNIPFDCLNNAFLIGWFRSYKMKIKLMDCGIIDLSGTLKPSYVQLPNFKTHVCRSYGKYSTSIEHDDLYTAGGCQITRPVLKTIALVISVTSY